MNDEKVCFKIGTHSWMVAVPPAVVKTEVKTEVQREQN